MVDAASADVMSQIAEAARAAGRGIPPVDRWHPAHCGELDLFIRADGTWVHEGAPIRRPELIRLFSTVLRKDPEGHVLVTPVEKLSIQVEDLPFRAVTCETDEDGRLIFTTDVGDRVPADADHPLVVDLAPDGEPRPRLLVRGALWARVARPVFYDLVDRAVERAGRLVVRSGAVDFDLGLLEPRP